MSKDSVLEETIHVDTHFTNINFHTASCCHRIVFNDKETNTICEQSNIWSIVMYNIIDIKSFRNSSRSNISLFSIHLRDNLQTKYECSWDTRCFKLSKEASMSHTVKCFAEVNENTLYFLAWNRCLTESIVISKWRIHQTESQFVMKRASNYHLGDYINDWIKVFQDLYPPAWATK